MTCLHIREEICRAEFILPVTPDQLSCTQCRGSDNEGTARLLDRMGVLNILLNIGTYYWLPVTYCVGKCVFHPRPQSTGIRYVEIGIRCISSASVLSEWSIEIRLLLTFPQSGQSWTRWEQDAVPTRVYACNWNHFLSRVCVYQLICNLFTLYFCVYTSFSSGALWV